MRLPQSIRPGPLLVGACLLAGVAGCGQAETKVSGIIRVHGKAPRLPGMEIQFLAEDGRSVRALVNEDGTYAAAGVPVGDMAVGIVYTPVAAARAKAQGGLPRPDPTPRRPVPAGLRPGTRSRNACATPAPRT